MSNPFRDKIYKDYGFFEKRTSFFKKVLIFAYVTWAIGH